MRGSLTCWLRLISPVVAFGFRSFGWFRKLKKSPASRSFTFSVNPKYLKSVASALHERGPRKKLCEFQLRLSAIVVVTTWPFGRVNESLLLKPGPTGLKMRCELSTGTRASSLAKSTLVADVGSKSPAKYSN